MNKIIKWFGIIGLVCLLLLLSLVVIAQQNETERFRQQYENEYNKRDYQMQQQANNEAICQSRNRFLHYNGNDGCYVRFN